MSFYGVWRNCVKTHGFKKRPWRGQTKIEIVKKLPPPINVKGIKSFLGYAEFYKRFTKDFFKIARPMCNLFEKDAVFKFDEDCLQAFEELKAKLGLPILLNYLIGHYPSR